MEQILLACGFLTETVTATMMLYKNTKAMIHSLDDDTEFYYHHYVCNLPRLHSSNINISNKKKNGFTQQRQEADDIL